MLFEDRTDAGRLLADKLEGRIEGDGIVLAIPRGGVVVGAEVARRLGLDFDLIIPRKIGSPHNPEMAIGAVTQDGTTILNQPLVQVLGISQQEIEEKKEEEIREIKRRMALYRGVGDEPDYGGRQVVVVDDGVATGFTMLAGLRSIKNYQPRELILAVPVAPPDTLRMLEREADLAVCLATPVNFYAVGQFYLDFDQVCDDEVIEIIKGFRKSRENKNTSSPK